MNTVSSMAPKKKRMYRSSLSSEHFSRVVGSNGNPRRSLVSRSQSKHTVCNARNRRELSEEDAHFEKQFGKGRFINDSECMWLSSDCFSASSFFNQYRFSGSRQSVDEWLTSWLSKISWVTSTESTTLDLKTSLKGDAEDEEAVNWLLTPFEDEASFSSLYLSGDTTSTDNSISQSSRNSDLKKQDLDGADFILSSGSVDGEDCKWISKVESGWLESFQLDGTSSPSLQGSSSCSSAVSHHDFKLMPDQLDFSSENVSATADLNGDGEPIFWPFEGKFDPDAEETMRYLSMSPRRDTKAVRTPKSIIARRLDEKGGARRQLQFESSGSKSLGRSGSSQPADNGLREAKAAAPSRLRRNLENCTKIVPLASDKSMFSSKKSPCSERQLFLEEDFPSKINYELPIEKLLGLPEFDGHEGVEAEFDGDVFLFDESLQQFL